MSKIKVGQVFHRLTVLRLIYERKNPKAECVCNCGKVITPQRGSLLNGRAKSCGCLRAEQNAVASLRHGQSQSKEYRVFSGMKSRCSNPRNPHFANYGGRGIQVLYASFEEFLADVGPRPEGTWIERLNNELHYQPGNCEWVPPKVNQTNKRVSKIWSIDGVEYASSKAAAQALGVDTSVINRGCNGFTRAGRTYAPRAGWSCWLKYSEAGEAATQ